MNAAHLHLITTHAPATMVVIGAMAVIIALVRKSDELHRCALILFAAAAIVSVIAYLTGEPAAEHLKTAVRVLPADEMDRHSEIAAIALGFIVFQGSFALVALLVWRKKPLGKRIALTTLVLSLASGVLLARTAQLGADIRHPELRSALSVQQR